MKRLRQKNSRSLFISLTLVGLVSLCRASAQAATTGINCIGNLDFGTIIPATGPGTVTLKPGVSFAETAGGVSVVGGSVIIPSCVVSGDLFSSAEISVDSTTAVLNGPGGNMVVNNFNVGIDGGGPVYNGTAVSDIQIGATLNVGASQIGGSYSGAFTVTLTLD